MPRSYRKRLLNVCRVLKALARQSRGWLRFLKRSKPYWVCTASNSLPWITSGYHPKYTACWHSSRHLFLILRNHVHLWDCSRNKKRNTHNSQFRLKVQKHTLSLPSECPLELQVLGAESLNFPRAVGALYSFCLHSNRGTSRLCCLVRLGPLPVYSAEGPAVLIHWYCFH